MECPVCGCPSLKWLTVRAVARRFACSPKVVRRLVKNGEIAAVRIGNRWRIDHVSFDEYVRRESVGSAHGSEDR